MKKVLRFLIPFVLCSELAYAQIKCTIDHYSTENGLSHDVVTDIIKDSDGFMWFGTWNGINRFDGHDFVTYKSSAGDSSQLKHDRIDVIVEDKSKRLWLRGADKRIYRFDKKTERFLDVSAIIEKRAKRRVEFGRIITFKDGSICLISINGGLFHFTSDLSFRAYGEGYNSGHILPSNTIQFVHEDSTGSVWVGTSSGLALLKRSTNNVFKTARIPLDDNGQSYTSFAEGNGHLYFGSKNGSLVVYSKSQKSFKLYKPSSAAINGMCVSKKVPALYLSTSTGELIKFDLSSNSHSTISQLKTPLLSIYEDRTGFLWVEPENFGVIRVNPSNGTFQSYQQEIDRKIVANSRFNVFEDINGTIWVNMKGGGFGFFNPATGQVNYFYNQPNALNRRFSNIVYELFYDEAGVLWLGTDDSGINKIVFQANNFTLNTMVEHAKFRVHNEVRGLLVDKKDRLWIGAKSGKLHVYQGNKTVTDVFVNEPSGGLGRVYTMLEDRKGNIWLGTKASGLWKASPVDKEGTRYRLTQHLAKKGDDSSISSNQIYALLEDKRGRIWVGTFDEGLNLVVDKGGNTEFVHHGKVFKNYPAQSFRKIRHLALDKEGHIWIGTTDGLLVFDAGNSYRYKAYSKIPGDKQSIGNNDVQFVFKDSHERMWLGTSGGGIALANGSDPFRELKFKNYTTKDGLANDFVLSFAEDGARNLWIATQNGLSKFNLTKKSFRNFDSYDGLPKAIFSEASCAQLKNGTLIFGTTKGFISFEPGSVLNHKIAANIVFTNLQINNRDIQTNSEDQLIGNNINYVSSITLEHDQNIFSVDYATLDYRFNNKQVYAYRLKGFDNTWRDNKGQRRVTYTNLPPGDYVFEVRRANDDLYSNNPVRRINLTILPPPWRTWWAYLIYFALACAILEYVRRTTLTMLRLRNKITVEQKLAELKTNFFTNISHEIRTPLTLILNPIEELARSEQLSAQGTSYVNIVRKNADRMVRFINQLLDLRKLQSGKAALKISEVEVVSFLRNICEYFEETAEKKDVVVDVVSEQQQLFAMIDAEKIDIVVYNLLANAFKFSPHNSRIKIMAKQTSETDFVIEVHDQGKGVEPGKLKDIFELYYEGSDNEGKNAKGTGIGLALSKELVELHGGEIWAFINNDKGLTVVIKLKLDSSQVKNGVVVPGGEGTDNNGSKQQFPENPLPVQQDPALSAGHKNLVLLVEDNSDLRTFLKQQLSEFYRVEVAGDGEEGYKKAVKLSPDLIVSDVMMPKLDGIQMLDKLKNDLATSHIPVVLLTARFSVESQIEGLKYGADYYITKPFDSGLLLVAIDNLIMQRRRVFEAMLESNKVVKLAPGEIVITSKDETFLKEVIKVVENSMADPEFNIDTVAENIGMGRTTFYKKLKSLTNMAPVEFVRDIRLQRGKQLLDAGEDNIATVAYTVGFNNAKYFGTCFKEKYNITASAYLRSQNVHVK